MWQKVLSSVPKKQRKYYSGKKKRHTQKAQVVVSKKTQQVICTFTGKGREHDFKLFKRSDVCIHQMLQLKADKGYQGIKLFHSNSQTPHRKPPKKELSQEEKAFNRKLASDRMAVEHVIGKLKVFRILQERYRNRRKRFALRLSLIAGIYNYELGLS